MATRSDGRLTRKELEEKQELERLLRRREEEKREKAEQKAFRKAEILFTTQGYKAAEAGKNRGEVNQVLEDAVNANPKTAQGRRQQERVLSKAPDFLRDADEFAGKPVGNYEPVKPRWKEREEAAEKAKADAYKRADDAVQKAKDEGFTETEGFNPSLKNWGRVPLAEGESTLARGDEELVVVKTPSGGSIIARGKGVATNLTQSRSDEAMRLAKAEEFQQRLAERRRDREFAEAEQLSSRLADKGIDQTPTKKDGTPDVDKMRGMLSAATFQSWDDDKRFNRTAADLEKQDKRELRYWEQAQEGRFGVGAQQEAIKQRGRVAQLRAQIDAGESDRGGLEPGFYRARAEREDQANRVANVAVQESAESNRAQAAINEKVAKFIADKNFKELQEFLATLTDEERAQIFPTQT